MSVQQTSMTAAQETSVFQTLVKLFKLRIVVLLLFSSMAGAFLGAAGKPNISDLLVLMLTGGLAAAGASALNQYIERDSDAEMKRTSSRPLASGVIEHPEWVLWVALGMVVLPVAAVWPFNPELGFFLLLGAIIYVIIYTLWLKPRTILNIVIGGAAGSCAVLSGGAAVGAWDEPGVLALAGLLFLWTPTHFWALAILYRDDYNTAGVPMLPSRTNAREAAIWGLLHAIGVGIATFALAADEALGWVYLLPAGGFTLYYLWQSARLIFTPTRKQALWVFLSSNLYLTVILLSVCIAPIVGV